MPHDDRVPRRTSRFGVSIRVPQHWSPQTAEAIFDFLCDLEQAVFDAYQGVLVESAEREAFAPSPPDEDYDTDFDDDFIPY